MKSGSVDDLIRNPVGFLRPDTPEGIAISSRIRLARNLAGHLFPCAMQETDRAFLRDTVEHAFSAARWRGKGRWVVFHPDEMNQVDRDVLVERHMASRELMSESKGAGLMVRVDEGASIMVNEEDHLRIQTIRPGFCLGTLWEETNELDDRLSMQMEYAYDERTGYVTSCPTNIGTGLRVSVMLHLPGLALSNLIASTIQGIGKLGLAVRGLYGEGSDNIGNLFQVSNQSTLGESEGQIVRRVSDVISQVIAYERNARATLLANDKPSLYDFVGRAYGTLRHCHRIGCNEALKCLSAVRLGVDMDMFDNVDMTKVNELFVAINPAHLQKSAHCELPSSERDVRRATLCRECFSERSK
ncbi:MAG: protein arginine kinase [Victivallaceae bacterium]|nr:protein arginine kinase [Victivallaceae bacterium]